jgi:hypothetical protein
MGLLSSGAKLLWACFLNGKQLNKRNTGAILTGLTLPTIRPQGTPSKTSFCQNAIGIPQLERHQKRTKNNLWKRVHYT